MKKDTNSGKVETPLQDGIIKDLSLLAFKSMITLNGGAFIVVLTYLGNADLTTAAFTVSIKLLKSALLLFLAGISSTLIGIAVAYISAQATNAGKSVFRYNFLVFISVMTLPVICAALLFVRGVFVAISSIEPI